MQLRLRVALPLHALNMCMYTIIKAAGALGYHPDPMPATLQQFVIFFVFFVAVPITTTLILEVYR